MRLSKCDVEVGGPHKVKGLGGCEVKRPKVFLGGYEIWILRMNPHPPQKSIYIHTVNICNIYIHTHTGMKLLKYTLIEKFSHNNIP